MREREVRRITVNLTPETYKTVKVWLIDKGITMKNVVEVMEKCIKKGKDPYEILMREVEGD